MPTLKISIENQRTPELVIDYDTSWGRVRRARVFYKAQEKLVFADKESFERGGSFQADKGEVVHVHLDGLIRAELDGRELGVAGLNHLKQINQWTILVILATFLVYGLLTYRAIQQEALSYSWEFRATQNLFLLFIIAAFVFIRKGERKWAFISSILLLTVNALAIYPMLASGFHWYTAAGMFLISGMVIRMASLTYPRYILPDIIPPQLFGKKGRMIIDDGLYLWGHKGQYALYRGNDKLTDYFTKKEIREGKTFSLTDGKNLFLKWRYTPIAYIEGRLTSMHEEYLHITRVGSKFFAVLCFVAGLGALLSVIFPKEGSLNLQEITFSAFLLLGSLLLFLSSHLKAAIPYLISIILLVSGFLFASVDRMQGFPFGSVIIFVIGYLSFRKFWDIRQIPPNPPKEQ